MLGRVFCQRLIAAVWAVFAAVLLAVDAVAPATDRWAAVGRVLRTIGIATVGVMRAMWVISFAIEAVVDGSRMWISTKNYSMLAATAMVSGAVMGRYYATR